MQTKKRRKRRKRKLKRKLNYKPRQPSYLDDVAYVRSVYARRESLYSALQERFNGDLHIADDLEEVAQRAADLPRDVVFDALDLVSVYYESAVEVLSLDDYCDDYGFISGWTLFIDDDLAAFDDALDLPDDHAGIPNWLMAKYVDDDFRCEAK